MHYEYKLCVLVPIRKSDCTENTACTPYQCYVVFATCGLRPVQCEENRSQARRPHFKMKKVNKKKGKEKETGQNIYIKVKRE
jgi:hypothetical protein